MTTTDDRVRHHPESLHEFAKEAFRGERAPTALHQDVENLPRIIDGPPQPAALPIDHQTEFIEVPDVRALARAPQSSRVLRAEPQRPEADGFLRDLNPSGGHCQLVATAGTVAGCLTMWRAIDATGSRPR
jgi:hypothetical protein